MAVVAVRRAGRALRALCHADGVCRAAGSWPSLCSVALWGRRFVHRFWSQATGRRVPCTPPPPPAPADAHPSAHKSVLESANPRMDSGASGCPWSTARATAPSPGRPTPGVVKQDKSSGGSVDTTKTRSGPQRVRMSSGERPIGAAKGNQTNTEALCHPPPPPKRSTRTHQCASHLSVVHWGSWVAGGVRWQPSTRVPQAEIDLLRAQVPDEHELEKLKSTAKAETQRREALEQQLQQMKESKNKVLFGGGCGGRRGYSTAVAKLTFDSRNVPQIG